MKSIPFTEAVDDIVALKMRVVDEYIKDTVEPIVKSIGSPESLIGKKYEEWTPQDFQLLSTVYGTGDDSPLGKLIFNKEYDKLKKLEAEV
jgi:hypothetical protein